jgi:predicted nucleotidyltransferase
MNVEALVSTPERLKILRDILYRKGSFGVSGVSRSTGLSKGLVSGYLNLLVDSRVLERDGRGFMNRLSVESRALRILLNLSSVNVEVFHRRAFVEAAGLYGSWAKGANDEESDVDIWVLVSDVPEEELAAFSAELRECFGAARPLYLTREKLDRLRREDETFYCSMVFGSIVLYGDGLESVHLQ